MTVDDGYTKSLLHFNGADALTSYNLDQNYTTSNNAFGLRYNTDTQAFAGQFIPSKYAPLSQVIIKMDKVGTPSGNVYVEIQTDNNGDPSDVVLATSNNISTADIGGAVDETFTFSSQPYLTSGVVYHIVVKGTYTISNSNFCTVFFQYDAGSDKSPNGREYWNGSVWSTDNTSRIYYKEYYNAIIDESGKVWTAYGNAQLDTAQKVFGTASGLFDGTGDYINTPDSDDFNLGSGAFTVDFWVRFNALPAASGYVMFCSQYQDGLNNFWWGIQNIAGTYQLQIGENGANIIGVNSPGLATGTWYHLAYVRSGNSWMIFQSGTQVGATTTDSRTVADKAANFQISYYDAVLPAHLNGWIDEFRFSKGVARWTSNFTVPSREYGIRVPLMTNFF